MCLLLKNFLIAILIITNLASCATKQIWRHKFYKKQHTETYNNFFITEEGKKIVVLGDKYRYIFDDNLGRIKKILSLEGISKFSVEIDILIENEVRAYISITLKNKTQKDSLVDLTDQERIFLTKEVHLPFEISSKKDVHLQDFSSSTTRCLATAEVYYDKSSSLIMGHQVTIREERSSNVRDKATKIALTPLTLISDSISTAFLAIAATSAAIAAVPYEIFLFATGFKFDIL